MGQDAKNLFEGRASGLMNDLKDLYAELFVLLNQTVSEAPDESNAFPKSEALQPTIDDLMRTIDGKSEEFRNFLTGSGDWKQLARPDLRIEIEDFTTQLSTGLEIMSDQLNRAMNLATDERDEVRNDLSKLNDRQRGRQAYRDPSNDPSALFDSEA